MPIGDNDLISGVFFSDFGRVITFGSQSIKGNFDAPGKDGAFGMSKVSDTDYRIELAAVSLNPFPVATDTVYVDGVAYKVRCVDPMDDGAIVGLGLRKL
jgi:hypothetical protein